MNNLECTNERWAPIPGTGGQYEASSIGRIRNRAGKVRRANRNSKTGYFQIGLRYGGVDRSLYVHSLVLEAFVGPRPEHAVTRHLNGNPADNRLENLAWGTPSENARDRVRHGRDRMASKTHCVRGHPLSGDHIQDRSDGRRLCRACARYHSRIARGWGEVAAQSLPKQPPFGTSSGDPNRKRRAPNRKRRARTHCKRGHEYTPENTLLKAKGRACRACQAIYQKEHRARKAT